ncbi:hypothetical protein D3OALGA1CA_929 [Olavius algarvensis associated proteobacterium Delta 3]|nr:hypothetical protein D3OALGA1CA_929 [Olavius algarvensis associated proteobacterium Delta 3]CAB5129394.1 hypothetical protein D3OALGB2SA_3515 [Olavius algarvensis associated proteobacterium Delta 3]
MWIVDSVESRGVIGIGFGSGIDFGVGHSVSIPIPNMSMSELPRNDIRLTETRYVQTEQIYGNDYNALKFIKEFWVRSCPPPMSDPSID